MIAKAGWFLCDPVHGAFVDQSIKRVGQDTISCIPSFFTRWIKTWERRDGARYEAYTIGAAFISTALA